MQILHKYFNLYLIYVKFNRLSVKHRRVLDYCVAGIVMAVSTFDSTWGVGVSGNKLQRAILPVSYLDKFFLIAYNLHVYIV